MEPLISVIVPVYKVEPYLRRCVDSILSQTYTNLEIILVDDGSPDNCGAICDEYPAKDNRVKVIHKENGGLSDARNVGMQKSAGNYISFVDSDDLLPADAVETLVHIARETKADLVIGGHRRFADEPCEEPGEDTTVRCMTKAEAMEDMLKNGCASWARLYRREIHLPILFPVGEINEDEAIVLQLLDRCDCIAITDAVVYHYRCREESITTSNFSVRKMDWPSHCAANLFFVQEKYSYLEIDAAVRYRNSLLWALREIALSEQKFDAEREQIRVQFHKFTKLFWNVGFENKGAKIRYLMARFLPFTIYRMILRRRHGT